MLVESNNVGHHDFSVELQIAASRQAPGEAFAPDLEARLKGRWRGLDIPRCPDRRQRLTTIGGPRSVGRVPVIKRERKIRRYRDAAGRAGQPTLRNRVDVDHWASSGVEHRRNAGACWHRKDLLVIA